jgi:threonine/homoserine/homoserine lactone efflux protein
LPQILGFVAVTLPLVATPGASTTVVLRNSIAGGTRIGLLTAVGCNTGNLLYGVLTAFGFAVALQQWPTAWLVLRILGVAYLAWLGLRSLVRGFHPSAPLLPQSQDAARRDGWQSATSGFFTNALNPSLAAFYFIVVPQFIPNDEPFARSALILSAIHVAIAFPWHSAWAVAGSTMARILSTGRPRQALDLITGIALLALALKVAL